MNIKDILKFIYPGIVILFIVILSHSCSTGEFKTHEIVKLSDEQISLAVVVKAKEGSEEIVRNAAIALLKPTRAEKGCINFTLHEDPNDKSRFMFYENWENKKLWDVHLNSPHIKAFGDSVGDLLAHPLDVTNWVIYE